MAAEVLAQGGAEVTVYDAMPSAGRKFLMAGRGGLNLTHSEPLPHFLARYREAMPQLAGGDRGIFAGCVARMERGAGAADLCRLQRPGVSESVQGLAFAARMAAAARCCGRAVCVPSSLDRLGRAGASAVSDAGRTHARSTRARPCWRLAAQAGRGLAPTARGRKCWRRGAWRSRRCRPANSGFTVAWSDIFRDRFEGQPLKGVALSFGPHGVRGEAIVTRAGIEGGAIYALSAELREAMLRDGQATLHVALRPDLEIGDLTGNCRRRRASNRCPTSCARPQTCRRSPSACCRKPRRHPAHRWRRCRRPTLPA